MDFFRAIAHGGSPGESSAAQSPEGPLGLEFETAALLRSSPSMRAIQPMTEDNARAWVRFWKAQGFIAL